MSKDADKPLTDDEKAEIDRQVKAEIDRHRAELDRQRRAVEGR